jgi:hypothetical protein
MPKSVASSIGANFATNLSLQLTTSTDGFPVAQQEEDLAYPNDDEEDAYLSQ